MLIDICASFGYNLDIQSKRGDLMATWIVHLRLAEKLYKELRNISIDKTAFYLGNIAIDSGKVNDDLTLSPPRYISHWFQDETKHSGCRYEDFFHTFLDEPKDLFSSSFYLGCVAHLIADNLWVQDILSATKEKYAEELKKDKKFILKPKKDWYDLDYLFVRENQNFEPLNLLSKLNHFSNVYLPWFDEDAIQLKIDELLEFYQMTPDDLDHEYIYLNSDEMENFINHSVQIIETELLRLLNDK